MIPCRFSRTIRPGTVLPVLAGILAALLCACSGILPGHGTDVTERLASSDARFTVTFPPAAEGMEPVLCEGWKSGSAFALTVLSPERCAGVTASFSADGTAALSVPGSEEAIPVDPAAAAALAAPFSLLCGTEDPLGESGFPVLPAIARSPDGEETVIRFPSGELILSAEGVPLRIRAADLAGNRRELVFGTYETAP